MTCNIIEIIIEILNIYLNIILMDIDIIYSDKEKEFYNYLFNAFKRPLYNFIEGSEFAVLMRKSELENVFLYNK